MKNEFIKLLNEYWEISSTCYALIKEYRDLPGYGSTGYIPEHQIEYAHHGMGYTVQLKSKHINFDFDFDGTGNVAGFKPWFVNSYLKQVSDNYPTIPLLEENAFIALFDQLEKENILVKIPGLRLYKWV